MIGQSGDKKVGRVVGNGETRMREGEFGGVVACLAYARLQLEAWVGAGRQPLPDGCGWALGA
jgi:hypothetical protein